MEKKIPTTKFEVDAMETKQTLEIYKWLTQDEENDYNLILSEGQTFDKDAKGDFVFKIYPEMLAKLNKHLFAVLVRGLNWEEFNQWEPNARDEVFVKLNEVKNGNDKKK